ncbi:MAG: YggS family pyridoxal phosphate-dependent enzyme [Micrococcales bacterium]
MNDTLAERYARVEQRISDACAAAGRSRDEVRLLVISKFHPAELVLDLLALGQTAFGENKDQEASAKARAVSEALEGDPAFAGLPVPDWHFVGQLQSNKVKSVLRYASTIHSLDRDSLLTALAKERAKLEGTAATGVFIELNLTDDPERGGIKPEELLAFADKVLKVDGLNLLGVMGVATLEGREDRDFETIARASENLKTVAPQARWISAGMSGDFEQAIAFGATHLRIGTAITGPRQYLT